MKFILILLLAIVAVINANPARVQSLIEQAQVLTKKAHDFIVAQQNQGNEHLLAVLERDARAVQVTLVDLMRHQQGHVHSEQELDTIETSLRQYEAKIEEDIADIRREINGHHHQETTTHSTTVRDHFTTTTTENPTTLDHPTTTEIHDFTTGTTTTTKQHNHHHHLPTPPTPNDNLETAAEDLIRFTDDFLTQYDGQYQMDIMQQVKIVRDLLAIARDPASTSDKFLTAVVLGNQLKVLRDLLYKAAASSTTLLL
ncbi:hypothetical protein TYRP_011541 [Tyrophagus putrescentiae]|nr:hypothetical protein TYRP_011541 [Tyrophagus putrescentiae]